MNGVIRKTLLLTIVIVLAIFAVLITRHVSGKSKNSNSSGSSKPKQANTANVLSQAGEAPSAAQLGQDFVARDLTYPEVVEASRRIGSNIPENLQFVSENIRFEAYDGALRGSRGTLLAKSGNSLDKSLLLRDLLRNSLPKLQVRFASCTLTQLDAKQLTSQVQDQPSNVLATESKSKATLASSDAWKKAHLTLTQKSAVEEMIGSWREHAETTRQNAAMFAGMLNRQGVALSARSMSDAQIDATRKHTWLQYLEASQWVDLDPSIRNGGVGKGLCQAQNTYPELPDSVYHHLGINVLIEERHNGHVETRPVLETTWRTPDLVGSNITYIQAEPFGFPTGASAAPTPPRMSRYTPMLLIDGQFTAGTTFYLPTVEQAKPMGQIIGTDIGGMLARHSIGQPAPQATAPSAEIIGIWLQLAVAPPDRPVDIVERPILDRIGYAARAAGKRESVPAMPFEVVGGEHVSMLTVWNLATWTGEESVPVSLEPTVQSDVKNTLRGRLHSAFDRMGLANRSYYATRSSLFQLAAKINRASLMYAGPDLSLLRWTPDAKLQHDSFALDLISRNINPIATDGDSGLIQFLWAEATLESERLLLADSLRAFNRGIRQPEDEVSATDVASVFSKARGDNVQVLLLHPGDVNRIDTISASDDARARLRKRMSEGLVILVPARSPVISGRSLIGWWSIDPNGIVIDEMEDGRHQSTVESPMVTREESEENVSILEKFRNKYARRACLLFRAVTFGLALHSGYVDFEAGKIPELKDDMQDAADSLDGAEKDCEGDAPSPVGPVGENDPGEPLPHISTDPNKRPKLPSFSGIPRGR